MHHLDMNYKDEDEAEVTFCRCSQHTTFVLPSPFLWNVSTVFVLTHIRNQLRVCSYPRCWSVHRQKRAEIINLFSVSLYGKFIYIQEAGLF